MNSIDISLQVAIKNGCPELYTEPIKSLKDTFPLRPRLMGRLIPQQMNLWMGASSSGIPNHSSTLAIRVRIDVETVFAFLFWNELFCPIRNRISEYSAIWNMDIYH